MDTRSSASSAAAAWEPSIWGKRPPDARWRSRSCDAQYAQDEEFRVRFRQEVAAARRVSGAFTAPVVDADPEAEQPWMATLYVPGRTLGSVVAETGPLGGRELRLLALGLVEALRDIHRAGVVHRDLKPGNVLMAEDGPRVIDFGISHAADHQALTVTGRLMGTPPFMSPEQFASPRDVTAASDVFSLGSAARVRGYGARSVRQRQSVHDGLSDRARGTRAGTHASATALHRGALPGQGPATAACVERVAGPVPTLPDTLSPSAAGSAAQHLASQETAPAPGSHDVGGPTNRSAPRAIGQSRRRHIALAVSVALVVTVAGVVGYHFTSGRPTRQVTDHSRPPSICRPAGAPGAPA
ncbi:protein kinase [Streptomyces sp. KL116D]|uniref:protein kinase domain-containing protein n=1 Tax=Streptomyces sp. KL116D TaxID=3045152 RepID=UPI00355850D4